MHIIIIGGAGIGIVGYFLGGAILYTILGTIFHPFISLYDWIVEPPVEQQKQYLQPVLEEIVKTPYTELNGDKQKFIINVNGKELLCTFHRDTSWLTGFHATTDFCLHMTAGIIKNFATDEPDIARKIIVKIEPHHIDDSQKEDFHSFEKEFAAVPNGQWYDLVPFNDYEEHEFAHQKAQREEIMNKHKQEREQKKKEEDSQIRRVPSN